jgi:hypothetical protein
MNQTALLDFNPTFCFSSAPRFIGQEAPSGLRLHWNPDAERVFL